MAWTSEHLSGLLSDFLFEGEAFPTFANGLWLACFHVSPQTNGSGATESPVMPRTRIDVRRSVPAWTPTEQANLWQTAPIAWHATNNPATAAIIANSHPFQTEAATGADTANIISFGIYDAQTGGNLLWLVDSAGGATFRPQLGQRLEFAANALAISVPFVPAAVVSSYFATRYLRRIIQEDGTAEMPSELWLAQLADPPSDPSGAGIDEADHTPRREIVAADIGDPVQKQVRNDAAMVHSATTTDEPDPLTCAAIYDSNTGAGESNNFLFHLDYASADFTPTATQKVRVPAQGLRFGVL